MALRYSGLEPKANEAVESQVAWTTHPEIDQAHELIEQGQFDAASELLKKHLAAQSDSVDACTLLRDIHWKKQDLPAYHEATAKLCALHLRMREPGAAWQLYPHPDTFPGLNFEGLPEPLRPEFLAFPDLPEVERFLGIRDAEPVALAA